MEKDKLGRWIVDELVYDPHLERCVIARNGDKWYILSPGQEPREYRAKMSPEYTRLTWNHEYYTYGCVPRGGFKVPLGRAITAEEWEGLVRDLNLGDDDISNPFETHLGDIYGPEVVVTYTARQVRVKNMSGSSVISIEQRLKALGIEASNTSPSRLNIRVEPIGAGAVVMGARGGSVSSPAKSTAATARNAKRKAEGKPEGGRPASKRLSMMAQFSENAKECDRTGDVVLRMQSADSWRELATEAEAKKAPKYLAWRGRY